MAKPHSFVSASGYQDDELALPVEELDQASTWYCQHFGMTEIERRNESLPTVILERDGVRLGFTVSGEDAAQDGAAIRVVNIEGIRNDVAERGVSIGDFRIDERDGEKLRVFFVVAPDGLCYYFNEPVA